MIGRRFASSDWVRGALTALLGLSLLEGCTCDDTTDKQRTGGAAPTVFSPSTPRETAAPPAENAAPTASSQPPVEPPPPDAPSEAAETDLGYGELSTVWRLGEVHDLGPAGPTRALPQGVLFITRDDRLLLATRKDQVFTPLELEPSELSKYGKSPALTKTHVYWINPRGQLLRAPLARREPELLAESARSGTRVSALNAQGRDIIAFIREIEEDSRAFLWAEGMNPIQLSDESSTTSSVQLLAGEPHPRALLLEGRTGMSPVHLRTVRVTKKHVTLAPDEILWIGPGSHALTELQSLPLPGGKSLGLLATSRDVTHFGLAHFFITKAGELESAPNWRLYPNGIDPAPVTAENLCGGNYVLYALPTEQKPRSPQELRIARVDAQGKLTQEEILARSRAFNEISIAPLPQGAVISWTADRRTWGLVVGCP